MTRVGVEKPVVAMDYWETRLTVKWGLDGVGYVGFGLPFNTFLYAARRRVLLRHLKTLRINLSQATVLDVGSGTGFWVDVWSSLGVRSLASLDFTFVSVERLRKKYPQVQVEKADISSPQTVRMFGQRFEVISAFDVLYHILDDDGYRQAFTNVSELLAPGGYFIFSDFFSHGEVRRGSHQVIRTIQQVQADLNACGLKVVLRAPMFVLMNFPVEISARFPLLMWRLFMAPMHFIPALGYVYGAILLPIDLVLTKLLRESPTTEILICQKPATP